MKRTLAAAAMFALVVAQLSTLNAGAGSAGVITGTMRGPEGPIAGVRVNALDMTGTIVGSALTTGAGTYSLNGLSAGTFMVQAVSPTGTVMTTSSATLSTDSMTATSHLMAAAAAAPAAQQAAITQSGLSKKAIWWIVGGSAAAATTIAVIATRDDASPSN